MMRLLCFFHIPHKWRYLGDLHKTPMQEMQDSLMGTAERHRLHMGVGREAAL
jgi:hypothetical protein